MRNLDTSWAIEVIESLFTTSPTPVFLFSKLKKWNPTSAEVICKVTVQLIFKNLMKINACQLADVENQVQFDYVRLTLGISIPLQVM